MMANRQGSDAIKLAAGVVAFSLYSTTLPAPPLPLVGSAAAGRESRDFPLPQDIGAADDMDEWGHAFQCLIEGDVSCYIEIGGR